MNGVQRMGSNLNSYGHDSAPLLIGDKINWVPIGLPARGRSADRHTLESPISDSSAAIRWTVTGATVRLSVRARYGAGNGRNRLGAKTRASDYKAFLEGGLLQWGEVRAFHAVPVCPIRELGTRSPGGVT